MIYIYIYICICAGFLSDMDACEQGSWFCFLSGQTSPSSITTSGTSEASENLKKMKVLVIYCICTVTSVQSVYVGLSRSEWAPEVGGLLAHLPQSNWSPGQYTSECLFPQDHLLWSIGSPLEVNSSPLNSSN